MCRTIFLFMCERKKLFFRTFPIRVKKTTSSPQVKKFPNAQCDFGQTRETKADKTENIRLINDLFNEISSGDFCGNDMINAETNKIIKNLKAPYNNTKDKLNVWISRANEYENAAEIESAALRILSYINQAA